MKFSKGIIIGVLLAIGLSGFAYNISESILRLGKGILEDTVIVSDQPGQNDPYHKYDSSSGKWVFSNDGTNEKTIGSGSGGGSGVNFLAELNADFEAGTDSWTASGGTFQADTTTPLFGLQSGLWDSNASGQTLSSALVEMNNFRGAVGRKCQAEITYRSVALTKGDLVLNVLNQSDELIATTAIDETIGDKVGKAGISFDCLELGDSLKIQIESTVTDAEIIRIDDVFLGTGKNSFSVAQNAFYGGVTWANDCDWTSTSTSPITPTDSNCTASIDGNISFPNINQPVFTLDKIKPSTRYKIKMNALFIGQSEAIRCEFNLYKGSIDTANIIGHLDIADLVGGATQSKTSSLLIGEFTSGPDDTSETIVLGVAKGGGNNGCIISNRDQLLMTASVYEYPSQPLDAVTLETTGFVVNGKITGGLTGNPALGTTLQANYILPESTSLIAEVSSGSSPVNITCKNQNSSGTTCSGANETLGIEVNIPKSGVYRTCMTFNHYVVLNNGTTVNNFKLARMSGDGATILEEGGKIISNHFGFPNNVSGSRVLSVCENFYLNAGKNSVNLISRNTFVAGTISNNNILMEGLDPVSNPTQDRTFGFSMFSLSESFPTPVFTDLRNSLANKLDIGEEGVKECHLFLGDIESSTGLGRIIPSNCVLSATDIGTNGVKIDFQTGYFNELPTCTCSMSQGSFIQTSCIQRQIGTPNEIEIFSSANAALILKCTGK